MWYNKYRKREIKEIKTMTKRDTIALNPTNRPKNGQQFCTPRVPYWKTPEYKKMMAEKNNK